jgi:hypothetical protein
VKEEYSIFAEYTWIYAICFFFLAFSVIVAVAINENQLHEERMYASLSSSQDKCIYECGKIGDYSPRILCLTGCRERLWFKVPECEQK